MTAERVLIIGGGFLGSALAEALDHKQYRVTVLSPKLKQSEQRGQPIAVCGRQEDEPLMAALLREHDTVIHAAWGTTPNSSAGRPTLEIAAGVMPWLAFLETLKRFPAVRVLFLSSGGTVYGSPERLPVAEDFPLQPLSCHGSGKAAAELFLSVHARTSPVPPIVLRPSNVYGPRQPLRSGFGVLRHLLQCAVENSAFELWGDGSQVRDYLYVEDFVNAVVQLVERRDISGTFNIGSGSGISLLQLISLVERVIGRKMRIESLRASEGDVGRIALDTGKIREATGWEPAISLSEGIARTWHWLKDER